MLRDEIYIRYPQGAGGRWLLMIVDKIFYGDFSTDTNISPVNFHFHTTQNRCISAGHAIKNNDDLIFGGLAGFNFFLNFWWKHRVYNNYNGFNKLSDYQKLNLLSEEARWILYDKDYKSSYYDNLNLDWAWIWQNPNRFKKEFMGVFGIQSTIIGDQFLDTEIGIYKKSCVRPESHWANPWSLPWLSWCYSIICEENLDIGFEMTDDAGLVLLSKYVQNNINKFEIVSKSRALLY